MAASLNKVFLIGNLTRDPETRTIGSGRTVAKMGMAVNREWRDQSSGEQRKETTFIDVEAWGRLGENCARFLAKGRAVFIEGRLKLDSWETQDGQKRNKLYVVAENVQFLGSRRDAEAGNGGGGYGGGGYGGGGGGGGYGGGGGGWGGGSSSSSGDDEPIEQRMGVAEDEVPF